MTIEVTATEAKAKLLSLLDRVEAGEEVTITRHGHTVARLSPARAASVEPGWLAGVAKSTVEDELLLTTGEEWEAS